MPALYAVTIKTLCAVRVNHVKVANSLGRHAPPSQTPYAMIVVNVRPVKNQNLAPSVKGAQTLYVEHVRQGNTKTVTIIILVPTVLLDILHLHAPPQQMLV